MDKGDFIDYRSHQAALRLIAAERLVRLAKERHSLAAAAHDNARYQAQYDWNGGQRDPGDPYAPSNKGAAP